MIIWGLIELTISTVGGYNLVKGLYNMYRDAEEIKNQYRRNQKLTEQYKVVQGTHNTLTESTYHRFEGDFLVLNRSQMIDPYHNFQKL